MSVYLVEVLFCQLVVRSSVVEKPEIVKNEMRPLARRAARTNREIR